MLKYDSIHGVLENDIHADEENIYIDGKAIRVTSQRDPKDIPYDQFPTDIVIESTGLFKNKQDANKHLKAGAKKVIVSAPNDTKMFVVGVNHTEYNPKTDLIVSCGFLHNQLFSTNCKSNA